MSHDEIIIRGAKEHNLKDIDVSLPRNKLVVLTGVSGSGKSSLAFDTLYAEGQRRYVESLSSYARQFIGQMEKPKVDYIGGLSPAIAIEQKAVSKNPRSTVGTVTEIYDYLRVLFARVGTPYCPQCGREVRPQSAQDIVDQVSQLPAGTRLQLMAPLAYNRKGTFKDAFIQAREEGFSRVRVDGEIHDLTEKISLEKTKKHVVELVVDRLVIPTQEAEDRREFLSRLTDSVETALKKGDGIVVVDGGEAGFWMFSEKNSCPVCNISFPELNPAMFSFNAPAGMCPECNGLGIKLEFDPDLFISDPNRSVGDGAVRPWGEVAKKPKDSWIYQVVSQILGKFGHDMDTPWKDLSEECRQAILYGSVKVAFDGERNGNHFHHEWNTEGVVSNTRRLYHQTHSDWRKRDLGTYMGQQPCPTCKGQRLRPESAAVKIAGKSIIDATEMSIGDACEWIDSLNEKFNLEQLEIGEEVLKEIRGRLQFLVNVGLHYLTLDRPAPTLSGGEGQRIRLASQVGCGLVGVLYVLDEPSIGLHQRDNRRLLEMLCRLRDMGNTVVVVEHDEETMLNANWIVDLGPGAGINGGYVVAAGTPEQIMANEQSLTGQYLSKTLQVSSPNQGRRPINGKWLRVYGARQNNLKNIDVGIPLGLFTCITGVSGSGKSSLIAQTLYPALASTLHGATQKPGIHDHIEGLEHISKVINITQEPIGRTPRSNPATYVQVMNLIRDLFAMTPEAKMRGYQPGRFSFNVKGGRCEACQGHGKKLVEMHFLPDVWVQCNVCKGKRFNQETLQIQYKGKNISEVLDMDVDEALEFFGNVPSVTRILQTLSDVGMGYIKLGQSATTLSGGEAQRVKLAKELARISTGDTVYILDEPTTGLHFADIQRLLDVLHRLTDFGNTVIVIEHNLDVIKTADWIIDLGPEGGDQGGRIVAQGTPEDITTIPESYTGKFLEEMLCIPVIPEVCE